MRSTFLFLFILYVGLFPSLFAQTETVKVQLEINPQAGTPEGEYFIGRFYDVTWTVNGRLDGGQKFHLVYESPDHSIRGGHVEVDTKKVISTTSVAQFQFFVAGTFDLVAYDDENGPGNFTSELARLHDLVVIEPIPTSAPSPSASNSGSKDDFSHGITDESRRKTGNTAIIVGAVLGAAIGLCVIIILVYICVLRPRLRKKKHATEILGVFSIPRRSPGYPIQEKRLGLDHTNTMESGSFFFPEKAMVESPISTSSLSQPQLSHLQVSSPSYSNTNSRPPLSPAFSVSTRSSRFTRTTNTLSYASTQHQSMATFQFPSVFTDATPPVRLTPLTDRQMGLQQRIYELKAQLISTEERIDEFDQLKRKIERTEGLMNSDWALERTDDIPEALVQD